MPFTLMWGIYVNIDYYYAGALHSVPPPPKKKYTVADVTGTLQALN